ncbi:MAG: acetoacetate--CoA ligase [Bacteroidota bacterium]
MHNAEVPAILWTPSDEFIQNSNLQAYINWLHKERGLEFTSYQQLWEWSIADLSNFWLSIVDFFKVKFHTPYDQVLRGYEMPDYTWFEGAQLNYAEHIFANSQGFHPAIIFKAEGKDLQEISWFELKKKVSQTIQLLRSLGVKKGDRVVGFVANIPEATIAFLACCTIGATWSSCSPDFGAESVIDRFEQIAPKVLIAVDGYQYGGKSFDKSETVRKIIDKLPSLEKTIIIPSINKTIDSTQFKNCVKWEVIEDYEEQPLIFEPVAFDHPIWVLFSSGTTGKPKAITHGHGGVLLEHLKYMSFHNDVKPREKFFWYTTTGWMMWNYVQAALLRGATIVLYEGSPAYPNIHTLWEMAAEIELEHFGTSAPFLVASMKKSIRPGYENDLSKLRTLSSTGAPLPPEAFNWVYSSVKRDLWLCSMSGGTDVCTAFVGGCPMYPVFMGEIQCRALGCALYAYDENQIPIMDQVGEMVIVKPMPSMPIYFWNDPNHERYLSSYFEMYKGIWRHGDWVQITSRNSLVIQGRSDATLNRQGVRIGTAEIYRSIDKVVEIKDSLIVNLELKGGKHYMPLFVLLDNGNELDQELKQKIKKQLRSDYSPRHVPDEIIEVKDIPYTISGKKLEAPVKKILLGRNPEKAANKGAMRNPESLDFFVQLSKDII